MKALVVYYSRNEAMHAVAHAVAAKLGADIDALLDHLEPDGFLGWRRCPVGAGGRLVRLDPEPHDLADYDIVVVGTPVRDTSIAQPIADFLSAESRKVRSLALFCSSTTGLRGTRALASMARASRRAPIAALAVTSADVDGGRLADLARDFAESVRAAVAHVARDAVARAPLSGGAVWPATAARKRSMSSG